MPRLRDRSRPLEVWAGIECTVNRVLDAYVDQIELTGHAGRVDDLDRFAALGDDEPLTTARFSALYGHWYPHARDGAAFARALAVTAVAAA